MNNNFRQSVLGRPSPVGRPSLAGRQSLLGRPGSSIPRPTTTNATVHNHTGNTTIISSTSSGARLGSSILHSSRPSVNENVPFPIPLLKPQAIISCLADLSVSWTEEDVARPTPQKVLLACETFLEVAMGRQRDDCTLEDIQNTGVTIYPEFLLDSVRFHVFMHQLSNLMYEIGVTDFTSRDVTKPEAGRVCRILSAVINFAKFKEDRQGWFYQELRASEEIMETIDKHERDNEDLKIELETLRQKRLAEEPKIDEIKVANKSLASDLEIYKKKEMEVTRIKDEVSKERATLNEHYKELTGIMDKANKELAALQAQRVDVPETLEQDLISLPLTIQTTQAKVDQCQKQLQNRYAEVRDMESIPRDLSKLCNMLEDTQKLLEMSHRDRMKVDSTKAQIETETLTLESVQMNLDNTERQTKNLDDKSALYVEGQRQRRLDQDKELGVLETKRYECETALHESRKLLEEKRRRQTEIIQREEQWAKETTEAMDLLKHQFECYMAEILPALRLT
ncbi:Nuf2 family-domain-containing protein [Mortierella sp. GBAus27b]|nr:Nuf2 family-domain-containing protein [Mortierella sp. GBAus27b]